MLNRQEIIGWMNPKHGPTHVVIDPFDERHLSANMYDVSLGSWYYRMAKPRLGTPRIYNPYNEDDVSRLWGEPQQAQRAAIEFRSHNLDIPNGIDPENDSVIIVHPLEMILCHTIEFIGGLNCVAGWMQGKSGWSRSMISVCRDAGLGDIGYVNRWTMEITNHHPDLAVPLIVGQPIAKIAFLKSDTWVEVKDSYIGSYQGRVTVESNTFGSDHEELMKAIEKIKASWKPSNMLPRLYRRNRVGQV